MYNKREIGTNYERLAITYLEELGYKLIEKNFISKTGEIDIIAQDKEYLVFIEVKYRKDDKKGMPWEAVDYRKQMKIIRTAQYYLYIRKIKTNQPIRFDIISILGEDVTLIQDAFSL